MDVFIRKALIVAGNSPSTDGIARSEYKRHIKDM